VKREPGKGDAFLGGSTGGEPERSRKLREQTAPIRTNPLGSKKGNGFFKWEKAAEATMLSLQGFGRKSQERRVGRGTFLRSLKRRKALKGKA